MEYRPKSSEEYIEMGERMRKAGLQTPSASPPEFDQYSDVSLESGPRSPSGSVSSDSNRDPHAHSYRLQTINQIINELESVRESREKLIKTYKKQRKAIHIADITSCALTIGSTPASVACLSSVVATSIGIGTQSVGLVFGFASILSKYATRRVNLKLKKHEKILELCQDAICSIRSSTSHALRDGHITEA